VARISRGRAIRQFVLGVLLAPSLFTIVWLSVLGATGILGSMSSAGALDPRRWIRLTWGVVIAAVAGVLLVVGGLDALQNGAIIAATPFGLLMVLMGWALVRGLRAGERRGQGQG